MTRSPTPAPASRLRRSFLFVGGHGGEGRHDGEGRWLGGAGGGAGQRLGIRVGGVEGRGWEVGGAAM